MLNLLLSEWLRTKRTAMDPGIGAATRRERDLLSRYDNTKLQSRNGLVFERRLVLE